MDSNEFHKWLIESFGEQGGEMAWKQFSSLPDSIKDELLSESRLPSPGEMRKIFSAFKAAGQEGGESAKGVINRPLTTQMALKTAEEKHFKNAISALQFDRLSQASSSANLWLDSASSTLPLPEKTKFLTPLQWTQGAVSAWASLVYPLAQGMECTAMEFFRQQGEMGYSWGVFAGGVPIPGIEGDGRALLQNAIRTNFAIQLGSAIGEMSLPTLASFDYGIRTVGGKAGALIPENLDAFAKDAQLPQEEVYAFYALREMAYARLYNSAPWIEGQISTLIYKYSRDFDLDTREARENPLREVDFMNPGGMGGIVNFSSLKAKDTEEQKKAKESLQRLLTLVESWVDCVTWRAGSAFIPHISELREMMRRRRAEGEMTGKVLARLMGLCLDPKRIREMCSKWDGLSSDVEGRDRLWSHPRLLSGVDGKGGEEEGGKDWDSDFDNLLKG
ncbi:MAG: zinc-dependent metalloprotease [Aeriscardovia sp.]|nr:zinc-dependent metalloprotease [Aeriscardovia sp.]